MSTRTATAAASQHLLRAYNDPVIFGDDRVFQTLLQKQSKYIPSSHSYYHGFIQPELRKEVADWMLEVCEHQSLQYRNGPTCPPEVFCLAMNYVDRFLSICTNVARSQLQLLGAVCLMVAWKVREHEPLPAQKLVEYSDFALTLDDIMEWEVLLLSKLEWDVSAVIAFDFVEHILQRLDERKAAVLGRDSLSMNALRNSSETLITMCSGHSDFSNLSPCLIATACVMSTLKTMLSSTPPPDGDSFDMSWSPSSSASSQRDSNIEELDKIFGLIREITSLRKDQIERCMEDVETMIKRAAAAKSKARSSSGSPPNELRSHDNNLVLSPSAVTSTPRRPPPPGVSADDQSTPTKATK